MKLNVLILTLVVTSLATSSLATTGRLQVKVKDENGDPLPKTRVTVTISATNRAYDLDTNKRGAGIFQGLPSGEVIVRFERDGYQIYETNALIEAGAMPVVEAELLLRAVAPQRSAEEQAAQDAIEHYNRAVGLYKGSDRDGAEAAVRKALELDPGLAPAHVLAARLAADGGDLSTAADAYVQAWKIARDPAVLPQLIQALELAGRSEEAASYARSAQTNLAATSPEALYDMAVVRINQGDETGAGEILDQLLGKSPDFAPAVYQRGLIRLQSGQTEDALSDFQHYVAIAPDGEFAADARSFVEALGG